jgi:hypothetical protein
MLRNIFNVYYCDIFYDCNSRVLHVKKKCVYGNSTDILNVARSFALFLQNISDFVFLYPSDSFQSFLIGKTKLVLYLFRALKLYALVKSYKTIRANMIRLCCLYSTFNKLSYIFDGVRLLADNPPPRRH